MRDNLEPDALYEHWLDQGGQRYGKYIYPVAIVTGNLSYPLIATAVADVVRKPPIGHPLAISAWLTPAPAKDPAQ